MEAVKTTELKDGIYAVMQSECGEPSQMRHEYSFKTLEEAKNHANECQEDVASYYDDTKYYVVQIIGVTIPTRVKSDFYEAVYSPPKPRTRKKSSAKKSARKKTTRKKK